MAISVFINRHLYANYTPFSSSSLENGNVSASLFFIDINIVSNSYKHSLCTFSPLKSDGDISFMSYTLKDRDVDKEISQSELDSMGRTTNISNNLVHNNL